MTTVASGRSRDAAQSIAKQYERRGYTVKIQEEYHPHGPGRAFKVVTMEDVPRGTGAKSADPLTPEEAAKVHDLLAAQKHAEPGEKHAVALAISEAIYRPKKKPDVDVKIVKDTSGQIIDVVAPTYLKPFHGPGGRIVYPVVAARKEYEKTDEVPGYVQEQLSLSPEMKEVGISEKEYEVKAFETSLGYSTEQQYQDWYLGKLKEHHVVSGGRVPSFVDVSIPESVSAIGAGREYSRLSYEMGLGVKSESKATEELQSIISGKVSALPDTQEIEWYKQYGGPEGTGVVLKPTERLEIRDKIPVIVTKLPEADKERSVWDLGDWWADPKGTFGGWVADITAPMEHRMREDWMIGGTMQKFFPDDKTRGERWRESRVSAHDIWESGDILGGAGRVVGSPLGLLGVSAGAGYLGKVGFKALGAWGAGAGTGGAIIAKTTPIVVGGAMATVVGADIGATAAWEEHGLVPPGSTFVKGFSFGVAIGAAYKGSQYTMKPETKAGITRFFGRGKSYVTKIFPKYKEIVKFQQKGMYAKRPGLGLRAEAYKQIPFYRKIDYQIKDFIKTSQFQKSILAYRKGLAYYGQELYPSAVKGGLIKDIGLYKPFEVKTFYPTGDYISYPTGEYGSTYQARWIDVSPRMGEPIITTRKFPTKLYTVRQGEKGLFSLEKPETDIGLLVESEQIEKTITPIFKEWKLYPSSQRVAYKSLVGRRFIPDVSGKYFIPETLEWVDIPSGHGYEWVTGKSFLYGAKYPIDLPIQAGYVKMLPSATGEIFMPGQKWYTRGIGEPYTPFYKPTAETTMVRFENLYRFIGTGAEPSGIYTTKIHGLGKTELRWALTSKLKGVTIAVESFKAGGQAKISPTNVEHWWTAKGEVVDLLSMQGVKTIKGLGELEPLAPSMARYSSYSEMVKAFRTPTFKMIEQYTGPLEVSPYAADVLGGQPVIEEPSLITKYKPIISKPVSYPDVTTTTTIADVYPVAKPYTHVASVPSVKPVTSSILLPIVVPILKPVTKPVTRPISKPITKPIISPIIKPIIQPILEPIVEPILEPIIKPVVKPITKPITRPILKPITKPILQPIIEPVITPIVKPTITLPPPPPPPVIIPPFIPVLIPKLTKSEEDIKKPFTKLGGARKRTHPVRLFKNVLKGRRLI